MASLSGLSVRVSASVADFNIGMERAQEKAQDLSLSLFRLGRSADEAEGEIDAAGRSALTTAGTFSTLTAGTQGLNLSFGLLGSTTLTVLVPALVLLSTTLVPITATLGAAATAAAGLAGAFGLIIGSGALAYNEQLKEEGSSLVEVLKEVKNELVAIVAEFGVDFIPLIKDAIRAIPTLVRNILDAVGGTDDFVQALRSLGGTAMQTIPSITAALFDLAQQSLPVLQQGLQWLLSNGGSIFDGMVSTAK